MAKKKAARGGRGRDILVVASKMKLYIRSKKMNASGELPEAISANIYATLDKAIERAKANGRKTVRAYDV